MISENVNDSPPKLGRDKIPPKMRKLQIHREIEAMAEAVAGNREVALELEKHPGMVGLEICLEKGLVGSDWLGASSFVHNPCT